MNRSAAVILSFVAYIFLFSWSFQLLVSPAVASDYVSNFEYIPLANNVPVKVGVWKLTPTVIICQHAPVSETQIENAVDFWKDLGYKFLNTQYRHDPLNKCTSDTPKGYIVIHLITHGIEIEDSALAQTRFYVDNHTNEIGWATIYMRSDIRETVLEHELGHALGFLHHNRISHLMNEKWVLGGWDKEGLKKTRQ